MAFSSCCRFGISTTRFYKKENAFVLERLFAAKPRWAAWYAMPVNAIVDNFDDGVSVAEISQQFEIPQDRVQAILTYAKSHRVAHSV